MEVIGVVNGKLVYEIGTKIYHGEKIIYEPVCKWIQTVTDGPYIAVIASEGYKKPQELIVIDVHNGIVARKNLEYKTFVMGICSERKCVFLLTKRRAIEKYSFEGDGKTTLLFDVWLIEDLYKTL